MKVAVLAESAVGERRVALVPEVAGALGTKGFEILVQSGAGQPAGSTDEEYAAAGAKVVSAAEAVAQADLILRVVLDSSSAPPELGQMRAGQALIAFLNPTGNLDLVQKFAAQGVNTFALELIPRITRAQSMDALSSMSTIAGYKAALLAANHLPKFFPMLMTAAGTLPPARALIIGAGVAGLQAIATCKRLGAIVEAFDVRPAVKEQVESLGARFVELKVALDDAEDASGYAKEVSADTHVAELELIATRMAKNDVVITTALIPGKRAPILITRDMVGKMPRGSVIVDLAAPAGGNCEATVPGETVVDQGVTIIGATSLLSDMATDASRMLSKNIYEFIMNLAPEGEMKLDLEDQIIRDTLVTHEGKVNHEPTRLAIERGGAA
jgi:NAD(P) transhydrogenase subunit alpha